MSRSNPALKITERALLDLVMRALYTVLERSIDKAPALAVEAARLVLNHFPQSEGSAPRDRSRPMIPLAGTSGLLHERLVTPAPTAPARPRRPKGLSVRRASTTAATRLPQAPTVAPGTPGSDVKTF